MNPIYEKALDAIWNQVNGGTSHPNDFEKVVDMFSRLLNANEQVDDVDEIQDYLEVKRRVPTLAAQKIQPVEETLLVDDVDEIQDYLEVKRHVPTLTAQKIQMVYETLLTSREGKSCWNDDFIQEILRK